MKPIENLQDFIALEPFFRIVEQGVEGLVDGTYFFDMLAEDVVFEYVITVPGYPKQIQGRQAVAELYRPYGQSFFLNDCASIATHHDHRTDTVILEYASKGRVVPTGKPYANRYISVLNLRERKVAHWRDYLDPLAVFDAIGWPSNR